MLISLSAPDQPMFLQHFEHQKDEHHLGLV